MVPYSLPPCPILACKKLRFRPQTQLAALSTAMSRAETFLEIAIPARVSLLLRFSSPARIALAIHPASGPQTPSGGIYCFEYPHSEVGQRALSCLFVHALLIPTSFDATMRA